MTDSEHDKLIERLLAAMPNIPGVEVPPKIFTEMQSQVLAWDEAGKRLSVRFPVQARYQNPLGMMQGGMIAAAIDNVFGPLSYLLAPPSVTMQMNTSYLKSVGPDEAYIDVTAQLDLQTRRFVYMSARVTNAAGEVVALSQASCMILRGVRT
ncbi:MAG: PaaI family thioesterase [Anaerolineales bacterium]